MNSLFPHSQTPSSTISEDQRPFGWVTELGKFFRRNKKIILICITAAVLLSVIYTITARPRFTAGTTLLIDERQAELLQQHPAVSDAQIENARIESEVEVLRSAGLARKVVAKLDLAHDRNFNQLPSLGIGLSRWLPSNLQVEQDKHAAVDAAEDRRVAQFLSMVIPHRIGLTYVIEIDATATDAMLSARLANGLADAYLAEQLNVKVDSARQASGWLQTRLLQLQDQALVADQAAQSFKASHGIVDTGHELLNEQQISEVSSQLVAARGKTAETAARLGRIRQMIGSRDAAGLTTSDTIQSPVINGLRERYLRDAEHVAEWSSEYGRDHAAVIILRKEMVQLQVSIGSEARRIEGVAESDVVVARSNEAALQAQLDVIVGQSKFTDKARATLRSLQSAADTYRSLYVTFLQGAMQTSRDQSFPVADVRVVTQARPPLTRSEPQGKLILAGAVVVGLGMGFLLGLLRDALDRRIRNAADLASQTGLSCLASLPLVGRRSAWVFWQSWEVSRIVPANTTVLAMRRHAADYPHSSFSRGISRLQLRLQQRAGAAGGRSIGLIAPTGGDGTTTVAANLLQSLLNSGYDATLLDLSNAEDSSQQIRGRLDLLRGSHGIIVIDFPPLSRPSEAHAVFADVGEIVLLVDAGQLDGTALLDRLHEAGLDQRHLAGVVLNRVIDRLPG